VQQAFNLGPKKYYETSTHWFWERVADAFRAYTIFGENMFAVSLKEKNQVELQIEN